MSNLHGVGRNAGRVIGPFCIPSVSGIPFENVSAETAKHRCLMRHEKWRL